MIKSEVQIPKVWRSELGGVIAFILICLVCAIASNRFPQLALKDELFSFYGYHVYIIVPILWFLPLFSLMISIYKMYNVKYKVDNRGIEATVGRISVKQRVNRVRYEDIRAIDIHQTIIQRMLDVGSLEMGTAASAETEVILDGISAPYELKDMLERERDARKKIGNKNNYTD